MSAVDGAGVDGGGNGGKCFRPILPVWVEFENGTRLPTYALLDSGSNRTVMTEAFRKRGQCPMKKERISVQGLGASDSAVRSVGSVTIRSVVDGRCATKAMVVVVDSIPVRQEQVATMEDVKGRDYLADVKLRELMRKEVGLLVGTDCASAFTPLEVRKSPKDGPMAWRTAFGWCLLGQDGADFKPEVWTCLLYTSPSPRDRTRSRMPSSA